MKRQLLGISLLAFSASAFAQIDRFDRDESQRNRYSNPYSSSTPIEATRQYNYDPSSRYRGTIDSDGSFRMRNYQGETIRGTIDRDGYGRAQDAQGNQYRIKP